MFEAEYLLFCESKAVDERGRLSLINIFDTIYAPTFPAGHPQLRAIIKLTAKNKSIVSKDIAIKITTNLKAKEISGLEAKNKVTVEKGNSLVTDLDLSQFGFPEPGSYDVKLFVDDKLLLTRSLKIRDANELSEK
jgi:hypothetical protein